MILVVLGALFAMVYLMKKAPSQVNTVAEEELVANTLNAVLHATTNCNTKTVEFLLRDCAEKGGAFSCGGDDSCDYAKKTIDYLLQRTFKDKNRDYFFKIEPLDTPLEIGRKCMGDIIPKESSISVVSSAKARLELCV